MADQLAETDELVDDVVNEDHVTTTWEFALEPPTVEVITDKLKSLPDWYGGLRPEDYLDFVQPLSQSKKVKNGAQSEYIDVWTVYMTVAGRITAVNRAASKNSWRIDFVPEPVTPTGVPGYLENEDMIVYREYLEIYEYEDGEWQLLGRKPGTAAVPRTGGTGAVASNRFEKVETAARGRAIAAWGIGVLPGSGVASHDEMVSAMQIQQISKMQSRMGRERPTPRKRPEIIDSIKATLGEIATEGKIQRQMIVDALQTFCQGSFGKKVNEGESGLEFDGLKEGELLIVLNWATKKLASIKFERQ